MLPFTYAVRNLLRDPARLLQTVGGSALVVLLLIAAVAFNNGMDGVLTASGSPRNVIIVGKGSEESIERSEVPLASESAVATSVRGLSEQLGQVAVAGEIVYQAPLTTSSGKKTQAFFRGVLPPSLLVRPELQVLSGHFPGPGEIMVGRLSAKALGVPPSDLAEGQTLNFEDQDFIISGTFTAPGTVMESELWLDRNDLATLTQRESLSAVLVRTDGASIEDLEVFALQRNDLELSAIREDRYYEKLAQFYGPIKVMTWLTAGLVAAGAIFGGLNTLYAAFASRIREMATLQAIGYNRKALLVSLLQESLLASLTGTLVAFLVAVFLLEGRTVSLSVGTFVLALSPTVILVGLVAGVLLGTVGTLPPAFRTLAPSLPKALRSQ
ncbi:ABC transporter permease [Roseibacillus persicicus]|uniref:ABC transporter substrate-binding protein n=1 Tax=Roseibacillus persicicus TaxID=454148 RepID=A0A918TSZ7_9BACT|nr:FtsX-like permease family protein [Roseibacillus persicicus]GHC59844.1 ABC transporter substrate-binding protein [Roseibacillus persicicus]